MSNPVVWQPSAQQVQTCQLSRFMQFVSQTRQETQKQSPTFTHYSDLHYWSVSEPQAFWRAVWDFCGLTSVEPASAVLGNNTMPGAQWFPGMTLNFARNLLRLAEGGQANNEAVVAYCETRPVLRRTYAQLKADAGALEAYFKSQGVVKGDRVAAIVTNGYEALVAMLATTSMGAIFSSASPDFGVGAILDRFSQIEPTMLVMVNGYGYGGKVFSRAEDFQAIRQGLPSVKGVVAIEQVPGQAMPQGPGVVSWEAALQAGAGQAPSYTSVPFDHPAYILFSSGTTGKPKCIVHGTGGILLNHAKELMLHGDIGPGDSLMYFTTCGWMMWNWQASGLLTGARLVTVDGSPGYPNLSYLWELAANEGVTHFGTSARFIAGCRKANLTPAQTHSLQKLRVVFSTGSPLLPEDYDWFYADGVPQALLGSIAGGTDICGCFVGCVPTLPVRRGEIQGKMLGADVTAFDDQGHEVQAGRGELVCRQPLPSMPVAFWNDPQGSRYRDAYFDTYPGVWAHGDFIEFTDTGGAIIYGRSDATLNPGGVRIGTAEIYRQVETVDAVKDSLVVGRQMDGDVEVVLLVVPAQGQELSEALVKELRTRIREGASPRHVPRHILAVPDIPYTRSGKKVELAVARLVNGSARADNRDALANPQALDQIGECLRAKGLISP